MAHQIHKADSVASPSMPQPFPADVLQRERDHLQALRWRLEAAAEALSRVRNQLQAQASGCQGGDGAREPDSPTAGALNPDGGSR